MDAPDRNIRQRLREKDIDFSDQLKQQMKAEQDQLRGYFKEFKKPVLKDPTVVKKLQSGGDNRLLFLKQAYKPFQIFQNFFLFWNLECRTKEERITHNLCKKNMIKNMATGLAFSCFIIGATSYKFWGILPKSMHVFGFLTAVMSGGIYGILTSTKFTLEQFEKLGSGYELGRIANSQIEKYRMDKPIHASQLN